MYRVTRSRTSAISAQILAFSLAACGGGLSGPKTETVQATLPLIEPASAKKALLQNRSMWRDPDSILEAKIGTPYACTVRQYTTGINSVMLPASCVCIELNAKNAYGGYAGLKRHTVEFLEGGGSAPTIRDEGTVGPQQCPGLAPFPELKRPRPVGAIPRSFHKL